MTEGPLARYLAGIAQHQWQDDPAQRRALVELERVYRAEVARSSPQPWWKSIWKRSGGAAPRGLYLWGGVGRGKTFLVDLFFECLPGTHKQRVHFHRFMQRVHADLRALGEVSDPLKHIAERIAADCRVLCFDEFCVNDIGDAMLLGGLLSALIERDVVLVATSNTAPANLYRDGLQRARFLPTITLLETACVVHEMVSSQDYRLRVLNQARVFHVPADADAERALENCLLRLAPGPVERPAALEIAERRIHARAITDGVAWFEFAELCDGPRAASDYIEIARDFNTVLVSSIPQFTPHSESAARRFVHLVDELYDRNVKLICSAAAPPQELYAGGKLHDEFARTASRLIEMQSEAYLAREHRP